MCSLRPLDVRSESRPRSSGLALRSYLEPVPDRPGWAYDRVADLIGSLDSGISGPGGEAQRVRPRVPQAWAANSFSIAAALVSLLDRRQAAHEACREVLREWRRPIVSTEAVLTEATHLLGSLAGRRTACVTYFLRGAAILVPMSTSLLGRCRSLMERYADLPMDYADATLVALAEELETDAVLTTDRRDFAVYRIWPRSGRSGFFRE